MQKTEEIDKKDEKQNLENIEKSSKKTISEEHKWKVSSCTKRVGVCVQSLKNDKVYI